MAPHTDSLKIAIDGKWELNDLHSFSYAYTQVYALLYSIAVTGTERSHQVAKIEQDNAELLEPPKRTAYTRYPWRGGYSAFGFYQELYFSIPEQNRPVVKSISYASPGWMELTLVPIIARSIETIVKSIARSVDVVDATYDKIHRRAQKRKILRATTRNEELKLSAEDLKFVRESSEELSRLMGFDSLKQLHEYTGDPLVSFKILLSFYRRVRPLVEYQKQLRIKL